MRAIDELKTKDNLSSTTMAVIDDLRDLVREERSIDYGTLEIQGIDYRDYPDFCDAYFSRGFYTDGTELSEEELDALNGTDLKYERILG
jgi:hypothetical protein